MERQLLNSERDLVASDKGESNARIGWRGRIPLDLRRVVEGFNTGAKPDHAPFPLLHALPTSVVTDSGGTP